MARAPATWDIDAVAIGASAGGVEVLSVLLSSLPASCRASFMIVMHIPRERPSLLTDVFGAKCALPVREAEDKEPVQPGAVYFAPPDYHLLVDRGPAFARNGVDGRSPRSVRARDLSARAISRRPRPRHPQPHTRSGGQVQGHPAPRCRGSARLTRLDRAAN